MSICSPPRLATVAVALVSLVAPAGAAAAPLRPTADFSLRAARPLSTYGGAKRLVVARKPRQRAFLRFVLGAPLRPGMRLTLRLYPLRDAPSGVALRHASDRAWSELSESFRTAPRTGPRTVASGPL